MIKVQYKDLAEAIGLNKQQLDNYIKFSDRHYQSFYIEKRNRIKRRYINSPSPKMKALQRWVLENLLYKIEVHECAQGFIKGHGIKSNAEFHQNKKYILCVDIYNFFPSITKQHVYQSLIKNMNDPELANKLAKICTYKNRLPQGAPSSPYLSNIVFIPVDEEIQKYCEGNLIAYSRYADDLSFSTNTKESLLELEEIVKQILLKYGFSLNFKKTRLYTGKNRMSVTGLAMNSGRPSLGKRRKREIKAKLFYRLVKDDKSITNEQINGYLSYVKDVEVEFYYFLLNYVNKLHQLKQI